MRHLILKIWVIVGFCFAPQFWNSQSEFSKWCFGYLCGLDFSTSPPTAFTSSMGSPEGCASIADNSGNLLFYSDAGQIRNKLGTIMDNGSFLSGYGSATQGVIILKQPGSSNLYYVFTMNPVGSVLQPFYSIVDISLAAGLGSVTVKNNTLVGTSTEKQVAIRHCNGNDVWIVGHDYSTNKFYSYKLTSSGVSTLPTITTIGNPIAHVQGLAGQLKVSPDGTKLAMATHSNSLPGDGGGIHMFDFDPATGVISNSFVLINESNFYGVEFSPDGSKLYATKWLVNPGTIFQWDLCAGSNAAIIASQYSFQPLNTQIGALQRAIDNNIYLVSQTNSIHVIGNPNAAGAAMGFSANAIHTGTNYAGLGLPNFINQYAKPAPSPFNANVACRNVTFVAPNPPALTMGCSTASYPYSGYLWDFGDGASGSANSSTLQSPQHRYEALGTYTVKLILYSQCNNDTLSQVVNITAPGPTVSVTGPQVICKGDKRTYTASGGTSYKWSNNTVSSTVALSPTQTSVYNVSVTSAGCTNAESFTVSVEGCVGFDAEKAATSKIRVFPQPFGDKLLVEAPQETVLKLINISGKVVLKSQLSTGENTINTAALPAGVYFLESQSEAGIEVRKVVKVE